MVRFRRNIRQDLHQEGQHVRDAEGLLETKGLPAAGGTLSAFYQITGHVNDCRLVRSRSLEDAAGGLAAVRYEAARGKMQVAQKDVISGSPYIDECLLGGRGTIPRQTRSRDTFRT